jgi:hypothetical protein
MKIKASFDFVKDKKLKEYYYHVPFHHDEHLETSSPYFILFVHEVTEPLIFIHTVDGVLKFENIEPSRFYIFDATKEHAVYPKHIVESYINEGVSLKIFDDELNTMYDQKQIVNHVLVANVFDWQSPNTVAQLMKLMKHLK